MTRRPLKRAAIATPLLSALLLALPLTLPLPATAQTPANPAAPSEDAAAAPEAPASETPAAEAAPLESEAGPAAPASRAPPEGPLVVVSWGGVYGQSQDEAILRPFTRATGIAVDAQVYAGDIEQIRAQAASGVGQWDVVDVDPDDLETGCAEGLFEKLSFVLPAAPDGTAATDDFLPGAIHPCGVGSLAWSMVIAHAPAPAVGGVPAARPDSLADFFDLTAFPGKRALRRSPMTNLEWALIADGVAPGAVYDLLRSEAGVERAFAKLDTIREAIVWWTDAREPARLLAGGAVAMASSYNAAMFNDIALRQRPFGLIWDGQVWDIDFWAIPAAAPNREAALEFLRFATTTQALARQTRWIAYGPVRRSSLALVEGHTLAEVEMAPFLPTTPENLATALRNDAVFWREEGPALVERFNAWLAR